MSQKLSKLADATNSCSMRKDFVDKLIGSVSFQRWYLLSIDDANRMEWFDALTGVDDANFDRACCGVLMSIFVLMEESMTSDDDKSFEKLFRDYFLETDDEMNGFDGLMMGE